MKIFMPILEQLKMGLVVQLMLDLTKLCVYRAVVWYVQLSQALMACNAFVDIFNIVGSLLLECRMR